MFKPLVIGSRMELVSKKSLRNNEERIVYASQILDFNDDNIYDESYSDAFVSDLLVAQNTGYPLLFF